MFFSQINHLPSVQMYQPNCFLSIQRNFFQEQDILTALSFYPEIIMQSQWIPIAQDLSAASRRIPELMKKKGRDYPHNTNPLQRPFKPIEAKKLLHYIAWNLYVEVMANHYIDNPAILNGVFDYVWKKNSILIDTCLKINVNKAPPESNETLCHDNLEYIDQPEYVNQPEYIDNIEYIDQPEYIEYQPEYIEYTDNLEIID